MAPSTDLVDFCVRLPKVELHAHINGSISPKTMHQLMDRKRAMGTLNEELAAWQVPDSLERIHDFFALFKYIYQLTEDEEAIRITTRNIIDEFAADGVKYLELRTTPRKNQATGMTKESYLSTVLSVVNEPRDDIIVRLIVSIDRRNTLEEAFEAVDLATKFRSQNVVGIDLCGDVSKGSFEALKPAFDKAKSLGFKVTLHFNEIMENMVEAPALLAFGPDRLGHATFLDDASRQHIYGNNIPVEICMTSNVVSKTVDSYETHHVKDLLKEKHPFVLCTDDKGVFFSDLSNEFVICANTFKMNKEELFESSYRAIDYIFADTKTKEHLKQVWNEWRMQEFN
ncbi:adenosine deaminase [Lichtheimia ornata]|uniref:Adenosine deaminase n=1 Tax=Lichtheimia ornata TaxID=688661 RepID=A0AAD7URP5_9FUNG|nr:adenosine deaminase [Lichtheimia ornata]KAJ8652314.1 adenosine deaminase [Lichtheimia ornata]